MKMGKKYRKGDKRRRRRSGKNNTKNIRISEQNKNRMKKRAEKNHTLHKRTKYLGSTIEQWQKKEKNNSAHKIHYKVFYSIKPTQLFCIFMKCTGSVPIAKCPIFIYSVAWWNCFSLTLSYALAHTTYHINTHKLLISP